MYVTCWVVFRPTTGKQKYSFKVWREQLWRLLLFFFCTSTKFDYAILIP